MQERLQIYKALNFEKKNGTDQLINSAYELYGACRHKTRFHRYTSLLNPHADERQKCPKKVLGLNYSAMNRPNICQPVTALEHTI